MIVRIERFAAICLLLLCMPCAAQTSDADLSSKLETYMKAAAEVYGFVGAVAVSRGEQTVYEGAFGPADREHDVPNTIETKFRLGSVTKPFTAMAILLLQDQGKLSVHDPISNHLENIPDAWQGITIHHLLTHTSGIHNYTQISDVMQKSVRLPATPDEVIDTVRNMPLDFQPGERFSYSNTGYVALGRIVERVAGVDYETFMRQSIFEPLGMSNTGYDRSNIVLPRRAAGYHKSPTGEYFNAPYLDMDWPFSAGALYSTVGDLTRWCRALDQHKLLSEASYTAMYTAAQNDANYAYGWKVDMGGERRTVSHGGAIHGFQSTVIRFPDEKLSIVVLSNVAPSPQEKVARELAAIAVGEEIEMPRMRTAVAFDSKLFDRLAGQYELAPGRIVSFRSEGDRYFTQLTGQDELEIVPESELKFFLKEVDAQVSFILNDDKTQAIAVVLHQSGRTRRAERIDE